jgi:glycosyltransferase involved in cell wall biosynthesis
MKLLVANDLYGLSSAAGVAVRMAEGLAARGHEVSFLATTQEPGGGRRWQQGGVDVHLVETPAYNARWRSWRSLNNPAGVAAMARVVDEVRPDLVHVHNLHIHLSYASLAAARAAGAQTILHVHDIMPVCHQKLFCHLDERLVPGDPVRYRNGPLKCAVCVRGRFNPLRNGTIKKALARDVDRLVAVSDEMGSALAQNGIGPCRTIFNGMASTSDPSDSVVSSLSERLHLAGRRVVMFGGRIDRLKGGLELLEALAVVVRKVPDAVLLLVGDALPGFFEEMVALAERNGVGQHRLVRTGWLSGEELRAAYALSDVVVSPSLCFESFGLVNLEAMAAGLPVVASMWGGPSDVVKDGETGFLVNPLQTAVLADRLLRVLQDEALAERMGAAGRARVAHLFSLEKHLDGVEALHAEMMPSS